MMVPALIAAMKALRRCRYIERGDRLIDGFNLRRGRLITVVTDDDMHRRDALDQAFQRRDM
jgi:hypothetical protein